MKNNILLIYAYLICFTTLTCGAIFTGTLVYDLIQISVPEFMLPEYQKQRHLNNKNFTEGNFIYLKDNERISKYENYTQEEITKIRIKEYQSEINQKKNDAIKGLIQDFIILIINFILFFIHWRTTKRCMINDTAKKSI